jgi:hypothetical protein
MNAIMEEIDMICNPMVKIWSEEHRGWWRPAQCGYTDHVDLAGEYTLEEAIEICNNANKHKKYEHYPDEKMVPPNETIMPIWE